MMLRSLVLAVVLLGSVRPAGAQAYENVGGAIADLPGAALWHFKVFVVMPDNFRRFAADVEAKRQKLKLKPGDEKRFEILFQTGPDGQPLRYHGLAPAGEDRIDRMETMSVGEISIKETSLVHLLPMPLLSREDFKKIQNAAPDSAAVHVLEYEDVVFTANAHNRLCGFDFDYKVDKHSPAKELETKWVNLLDPQALATADGRVILVSMDGEAHYQVFNLDISETESYNKGSEMKRQGTTVYILSDFAERKYVTAYRRMHSASVKPGQVVTAGQKLGMLRAEPVVVAQACVIPTPEIDPEVAVYRVNRKDQYYLRSLQKKPEARLLFSR